MHTIIHTSRCKLSQILHIYYENLNLNLLLELLFSNFTPVQMFIVRTVLMIKDKVITRKQQSLLFITDYNGKTLNTAVFKTSACKVATYCCVSSQEIVNFGFQSIMHTIVWPAVKSMVLISHRDHHYNSTLSSSQQSRLVAVQWNH